MRAALACVVAALGMTSVLNAQNAYQQQIRSQLTRHSQEARQNGYSADRDPVYGQLADDASESLRIPLTGGRRYAIVGVCDEDCSDIDLRIYSPDGTKLAEDIAVDDYPTVLFVAPVSGTYRLSVEMANCRNAPCYWGVQVFSK